MAPPVRSRARSSSTWPEQHQHDDDGGRLEVDRHRAVRSAERGREEAGRERRDHAVEPGHAGAERDQGEHVEVARSTDAQPRTKNGQPAQSTTGVASSELQPSSSRRPPEQHAQRRGDGRPSRAATTGTASASPIQNRRVMSASSGFGAGLGASTSAARAPCRRSGRCRARPAGPPGASGRCRSRPVGAAGCAATLRAEVARRVGRELRPAAGASRSSRSARRARAGAASSRGSTSMPQTGSLTVARVGMAAACMAVVMAGWPQFRRRAAVMEGLM